MQRLIALGLMLGIFWPILPATFIFLICFIFYLGFKATFGFGNVRWEKSHT